MKAMVAGIIVGVATANAAQEFGRYQVIVDKAPFGTVNVAPAAGTPSSLTRYAFVGLVSATDNGGDVLAIIYDKQARRHYFKAPGEMVDDVKVVRIETELPGRKLVLQRGLETASLTYEERRAGAPVAAAPGAPATVPTLDGETPPGETAAPPAPSGPRRIPFRR